MVRHRDPTARLRSLTDERSAAPRVPGSSAVAGRHSSVAVDGPTDPVGERAPGWVPAWDEETEDAPAAPPPPVPEDEPVRLPSRWHRLRERWVPEQLHGVRIDPGRRGLVLLSLVSAVSALAAALGVWLGWTRTCCGAAGVESGDGGVAAPAQSESTAGRRRSTSASADIVVSVTGAVRQPGLVSLLAGARVADAIAAAGGPLDGTDLTGVNLAARLADGDSVVVGGPGSTVQGAGGSGGSAAGTGAGALIDLNRADQATLETLPGVGPVMAGNIITWRTTNGPFTSVDQLQEVTGIGPSRFATLAPLVTV